MPAKAQYRISVEAEEDSLDDLDGQRSHILLLDKTTQYKATEALDAMYNFDFDYARRQFNWLKQAHPRHPLPYFLLGMNHWWQSMPNDRDESHDEPFLAYMDTAITFAERLYEAEPDNPEGSFFLAAAHGFKARLYSDRGNYGKATGASKQAMKYLRLSPEDTVLSPEFLMGHALYNYFREWIPDEKPFLKPVLIFFRRGDMDLGLQQLELVGKKAFYTRIEAMNFLVTIHGSYNKEYHKAFPYAVYLYNRYPNNAYFHRTYARLCYITGQRKEAERASLSILERVEAEMPGYEGESGRMAAYFLGYYQYHSEKNLDSAQAYFEQNLHYTKKVAAYGKKYFHHSLDYLGDISLEQGDTTAATRYYQLLVDFSDRKDQMNKDAREWLKSKDKRRKMKKRKREQIVEKF